MNNPHQKAENHETNDTILKRKNVWTPINAHKYAPLATDHRLAEPLTTTCT